MGWSRIGISSVFLWGGLCLVMVVGCVGCQEGSEPVEVYTTIEADWLMERVAILSADDMQGRDNNTVGGELAREYLEEQMAAVGLIPAGDDGWRQEFEQGVNLIGKIPGSDPSLADEFVILSAHYDHLGIGGVPGSQCYAYTAEDDVCNGASDNASGCIGILAVANAIIANEMELERSVLVVFFDAEEDGLLGSHYYIDVADAEHLESISAIFNVDTIGVSIFEGVEQTFALNIEHTTGLRESIMANNEIIGLTTFPVSSFFDGSDEGERSDHYPFSLAGVPAIFFGSGVPPEYHTSADEIGIMDSEKFLATTQHIFLTAVDAAQPASQPGYSLEAQRSVDDAIALHSLGEILLANPQAAGVDDPVMIEILEGWVERLGRYEEQPPQTEEEWQDYFSFIKSVLQAVYLSMA